MEMSAPPALFNDMAKNLLLSGFYIS
jgi:hypothetical protein